MRRLLVSGAVITLAGVALGLLWAARVQNDRRTLHPPPTADVPAFGQTFSLFFLGHAGQDVPIRAHTPLVPATSFAAGERVGLRVQTTGQITEPMEVELRFLDDATREETASLRGVRQRFTIRPGLRTYCCVTMPKELGTVTVGIIAQERLLGTLPAIRITRERRMMRVPRP